MFKLSLQRKKFCRRQPALLLLAVYLLISLSPLAPLAMHTKAVAHAVTGECAGDCNICGCSPASRANQTCCCARKNRQAQHPELARVEADEPECCRKIREEAAEPDTRDQHPEQSSSSVTVLKCGCPCDGGKPFSLSGIGFSELIPYVHECDSLPYAEASYHPPFNPSMASRHAEPPDPPPRLTPTA